MLCDYLGQYNDYTKFFCARSAGRESLTSHRIPKCKRGRECSDQLDRQLWCSMALNRFSSPRHPAVRSGLPGPGMRNGCPTRSPSCTRWWRERPNGPTANDLHSSASTHGPLWDWSLVGVLV
jgi:hypothetical protein